MAKVVSKQGRPKVRNDTNIEHEIKTQPIKNYWKIVCPITKETRARFPHHCWLICGLSCAAKCYRLPHEMCEGCPCLKMEE